MSMLTGQTGLTTAAVAAGTMGGVFFAFSAFVMTALGRLAPAQGASAMQAINRCAPTPWFMIPLFGTGAVGLGLGVGSLGHLDEPIASNQLIGSALYTTCVLVTVGYHVPRNNALAGLDPSDPATVGAWRDYVSTWTAANHLRTVTAIGAAVSWTLALRP